jgi:hypothetical protein
LTPDLLIVRAARLRRETRDDSALVRALGRWLDSSLGCVWNGEWRAADEALDYVRAIYLELETDGRHP